MPRGSNAATSSSAAAAPATEGHRMIHDSALTHDHPALASMLGPWAQDPRVLAARFAASGAVPHVVIDNFFAEPFALEIAAVFPACDASCWNVYDNPLERKRATNDVSHMPTGIRDAVCALCGPFLVEAVRAITGTDETLQADPYCHGGGLHSSGTGDKLDLHLDYSIHPMSGLERRFNLIVYLVEPWEPSYGGALELRGAAADDCNRPGELSAAVLPKLNRAVLFSTTAPSFHGFPTPITCPPELRRNSLALYYLTPPRPDAPKRSKALYVPRPGEPHDPKMAKLRAIRAERRLDAADVASVA